ncbi:hypothetical protein [Pseudosulfitobacter sp. SM2401]|jgi:hypothetical protein|nr:hypothetical protein [Ascidiaceihabitans sp.]
MQTLQSSYRGLSLLLDLNWDRALYLGTLTAGLCLGIWMSGL